MHPHSTVQGAFAHEPRTHEFVKHGAPWRNTMAEDADFAMVATGRQSYITRRMCAGLLSVLAVVAITLSYFRICYAIGPRKLLRRLAGGEPESAEDPLLSTILEMCLDMEEEINGCLQPPALQPESQWESQSSWQFTPPYRQGQYATPAVPWLSAWGPFQKSSAEQFFQPQLPPGMHGNYDLGWSRSVDEAHALPIEGPSTSWQSSSMLPPYDGSTFSMANDGPISIASTLHSRTPLTNQNLGLGSSLTVGGANVAQGLPATMEPPDPFGSGNISANGRLDVQPCEGQAQAAHLQADAPRSETDAQNFAASGILLDNPSSNSVQAGLNYGSEVHTSSTNPQPRVGGGALLPVHPFYKLPRLERGADLNLIQFSAKQAFSTRPNANIPSTVLRNLHNCFAKDILSVLDANDVVRSAQRLAGHLYYCHQESVASCTPAQAVVILGRRYIMMELLFCAIEVLGPAMNASVWWKELVNVIPSRIALSPAQCTAKRCRHFAVLAQRLSSAIHQLKQGIRPSAAETIDLKRELFCGEETHAEFKLPRWELWRRDGRRGRRGQEG